MPSEKGPRPLPEPLWEVKKWLGKVKKQTYGPQVHADLDRQFHVEPGDYGKYWWYIGVGVKDGRTKIFCDGPYSTQAEAESAARSVEGMDDYETKALNTRDMNKAKAELSSYLSHEGLHGEKLHIIDALSRKTWGKRARAKRRGEL
jgi:hypothetical protein